MDSYEDELKKRYRKESFYDEDSVPEGEVAISSDDTSEINPEELDALRTKIEMMQAIERLSSSLVKKREAAVSHRASCGIEQRWREDEIAFDGMDEAELRTRMIDYATENAPAMASNKGPKRSRVVANILRGKCETAEGRFSDILLLTDYKNWGLKRTPVPELVDAMDDETIVKRKGDTEPMTNAAGEPSTKADYVLAINDAADKKMSAMELVIDDQLTECGFNTESRKAIRYAVRLGTGILKGPCVIKSLKKTWQTIEDGGTKVRVLKVAENMRPISRAIDPWNAFPDPECGEDASKMAFMWDRESILPRELRSLIGVPGYFEEQILAALSEEPQRLAIADTKDNPYSILYQKADKGSHYEKWEYNGDLDKDDLEAIGCDCSDSRYLGSSVSACVVMVNDRPIKVVLNPMDTGEIPYDFFQWTQISGIPWGSGVPRQGIWMQRVITAALRAMMDNAGDSSGANVVVGKGVEPADGVWEVTGKKIWWALGDQDDVKKAFNQFQLTNNQEELERIIMLALKFLDLETTLPLIFQGEKMQMPKTLGATNIMVDSNNVALRGRVRLWDDAMTKRHLTRYYDYNMQYHPDDKIKGDYKVDARGTSALLSRDQQAETLEDVMSLREDKELAAMIDWERAIRKYFTAKHIDIMLPEEKIKANKRALAKQPPPADPRVQGGLDVAKVRTEGDLAKAQLNQQADMAEIQFKAEEARAERQFKMEIALLERDMKMMELSVSTGMALDKIKAELSSTAQRLKTQVALAKDKNVKPAAQVINPIAEPGPRAAPGHAFQD